MEQLAHDENEFVEMYGTEPFLVPRKRRSMIKVIHVHLSIVAGENISEVVRWTLINEVAEC